MGQTPSPVITDISWGRMVVEGVGGGKDFKLWPGGGREWDWRETDTHHVPGIQPADIQELLENGCQAIVLSRGMLLRLQTCQETIDLVDRSITQVFFHPGKYQRPCKHPGPHQFYAERD